MYFNLFPDFNEHTFIMKYIPKVHAPIYFLENLFICFDYKYVLHINIFNSVCR